MYLRERSEEQQYFRASERRGAWRSREGAVRWSTAGESVPEAGGGEQPLQLCWVPLRSWVWSKGYEERKEMYSVDPTSAILTEGWVQSLSVLFSSVTQSCLTLCNPMDCSTPGFSVHHQLPELAQTHVYWVGDAIQPSHPLLPPSLPAFTLSEHQGLFQWISSSHKMAKVLELQHQSFQ